MFPSLDVDISDGGGWVHSKGFPVCQFASLPSLLGHKTEGPRPDRAAASVPLHPCNHPMIDGTRGWQIGTVKMLGGGPRQGIPIMSSLVRLTRLVAARAAAESSFFAYRANNPEPCFMRGWCLKRLISSPTAGSMLIFHLHARPQSTASLSSHPPQYTTTIRSRLAHWPDSATLFTRSAVPDAQHGSFPRPSRRPSLSSIKPCMPIRSHGGRGGVAEGRQW
ncbi:uncharacterized protein B0H64DRAFT_207418 [Chaetomium fimeti]|uniref:Uncharacterized protein n=1 Tax=Chaetomium fimeti TaxID=1854472 RepID=A0AAE0HCN4_9PEZI|nr:hypothetical protein B0H64DRAFT_207418 [Chaetomium fimeti]